MKLSRCDLTVQIMRIITPQGGQTGNAYTRYQRGSGQQKINFHEILLCWARSTLCYLMITNDMNKRLFNWGILLWDNGTITFGTYMRILAPYPTTHKMKDIPLVNSYYPAIVIERPDKVYTVPINTCIQANQSRVAVLKDVSHSFQHMTPIQITCSGKHWDKAHPLDWCNTINQGCECYRTSSLGTCNIALMHDIVIHQRSKILESNFSSTKFNCLFTDKPLLPNTMVSALKQTEATEKLDCDWSISWRNQWQWWIWSCVVVFERWNKWYIVGRFECSGIGGTSKFWQNDLPYCWDQTNERWLYRNGMSDISKGEETSGNEISYFRKFLDTKNDIRGV